MDINYSNFRYSSKSKYMSNLIDKEIIEAVRKKNLVFVVGAGMSLKFGFKSWGDLVKCILYNIENKYPGAYKSLAHCINLVEDGEIMSALGAAAATPQLKRLIHAELKNIMIEVEVPTAMLELERKLWRISDRIITLNYDPVLHNSGLNIENIRSISLDDLYSLVDLTAKRNDKILFKVHGDYQSPEKCIFFPSDYTRLYEEETDLSKAVKHQLVAMLKDNVVVFLGLSLTDPYFNQVLKYINGAFPSGLSNYVFLTTEPGLELRQELIEKNIIWKKISKWQDIESMFIDPLLGQNNNSPIQTSANALSKPVHDQYIVFSEEYWVSHFRKKSVSELIQFYTKVNSSKLLLPYVIANQFYVIPEDVMQIRDSFSASRARLEDLIFDTIPGTSKLIRVYANGGMGKSTFLWHTANKFTNSHNVVWFSECTLNLPKFDNSKPTIVLLDNYSRHSNSLKDFVKATVKNYSEFGMVFITTERPVFFEKMDRELEDDFYGEFEQAISVTYTHGVGFYEKIFERLIALLDLKPIAIGNLNAIRSGFLSEGNATTAERIINALLELNSEGTFNFKFDWHDWEELSNKDVFKRYRLLYQVVASFNKYNITPPLSFCLQLLSPNRNQDALVKSVFIREKENLPIVLVEDKLELRNPNLSKYYIKLYDEREILVLDYFKHALESTRTFEGNYLLRNIYRNSLVRHNPLLLNCIPSSEGLIHAFIEVANLFDKKTNGKNAIELCLLLEKNSQRDEAKNVLREFIRSCPEDVHCRTKLASLLIREKSSASIDEANGLIGYVYEREPDNPFVISLILKSRLFGDKEDDVILRLIETAKANVDNRILRFLYGRRVKNLTKSGDFVEAKRSVSQLLEINPNDFTAYTQLAIINKEEEDYDEAIANLRMALKLNSLNPHSYGQLGIVYGKLFDATKVEKYKSLAIETFEEGRKKVIYNVPLEAAYAQFLLGSCRNLDAAEAIFLQNLEAEKNHAPSVVGLAKIAQLKGDFDLSKKLLENTVNVEGQSKNAIGGLILAAKACLELNDFDACKIYLAKAKAKAPDNWLTNILLLKVYAALKEWPEYESVKNEVLKAEDGEVYELTELGNWLLKNKCIDQADEITAFAFTKQGAKDSAHLHTVRANVIFEIFKRELKRTDSNNALCIEIFEKCIATLSRNMQLATPSISAINLFCRISKVGLKSKILDQDKRWQLRQKYVQYLAQGFLLNRNNEQHICEIVDYLRDQRRYRLSIQLIKQYVINLNTKPRILAKLVYLYDYLGDHTNLRKWLDVLVVLDAKGQNIVNQVRTTTSNEPYKEHIGYYNGKQISSGGNYYEFLKEKLVISNEVVRIYENEKVPVKVCFNLKNGYANCVEPYFGTLSERDDVIEQLGLLWRN